jgi:hypothetical protein
MKTATKKIIEGLQEPTWEDCRPFSVRMELVGIMRLWDTWRKYIKQGGTASWPRDEFEALIDGYEENIRDGEVERSRLSQLLIEARIRIVRLEEEIAEQKKRKGGRRAWK